jgi:hypothetical protein
MYRTLVRRTPLPHIQNGLSFLPSFSSKHPHSERRKMNSSPRLPGCQLASLPETDLSSSASVRAAAKRSIFGEAKLRTMIADHLLCARPERAQDLSPPLLPHRASRNRTAGLPRTSCCKSEAVGIDNGYFIFDRSQHEARTGVGVGHRGSPG